MNTRRNFMQTVVVGLVAATGMVPVLANSGISIKSLPPEMTDTKLQRVFVCQTEAEEKQLEIFFIRDEQLYEVRLPKGNIWIRVEPIVGEAAVLVTMFKEVKGKEPEEFEKTKASLPNRIGLPDYGGAFLISDVVV